MSPIVPLVVVGAALVALAVGTFVSLLDRDERAQKNTDPSTAERIRKGWL